MKKRLIRLISVMLAVLMLIGFTAACGENKASQETTPTTAAGTEETAAETTAKALGEVTLKFVLGGTKNSDFDLVWNTISDTYKEQLNAKFDVTFVPWGDLVNKLMVMTSAGDRWDMNFCADWMGYAQLLNAGAFMPLNDLLPQYAPDLYAVYQSQGALDAATVSGNIMCLPWTMKQNIRPYFYWRSDLSPEIAEDSVKTIEDMDALFTNAKAKFPDLKIFNISAQVGFPYQMATITTARDELADLSFHGFYFDINDASVKIIPLEQTQAFKDAVAYAKKWYDGGIIAKDALVDKNDVNSYIDNGQVYTALGTNEITQANMEKAANGLMSNKNQAYQRSLLYPDKKFFNRSPLANVYAIGKNSQNPDRVLMFLNMMETNKDFYDMVMYGIKDKTYVLNGEAATVPPSVDPANSNYLGWASAWPMWKPQFMRPDTSYSEGFWVKQADFASQPNNINSPVYGLFFNGDAIKTELTQRDQLQDEMGRPLLVGVLKSGNVDKEVADYIAAQKAAGTDRIVEELQKQVDAYLASKK